MNWDEVTEVEMAPKTRGDMVLYGKNKRMKIPGTELWSDKEEKLGMEFFYAQIDGREIETKRTTRAIFQTSKNTRIKRT